MTKMMEDGKRAVQAFYKQAGHDRLLLSPPADNCRNIADFSLYFMCHKVRDGPGLGAGRTHQNVRASKPRVESSCSRNNNVDYHASLKIYNKEA